MFSLPTFKRWHRVVLAPWPVKVSVNNAVQIPKHPRQQQRPKEPHGEDAQPFEQIRRESPAQAGEVEAESGPPAARHVATAAGEV